jgi:hypothetical protein
VVTDKKSSPNIDLQILLCGIVAETSNEERGLLDTHKEEDFMLISDPPDYSREVQSKKL